MSIHVGRSLREAQKLANLRSREVCRRLELTPGSLRTLRCRRKATLPTVERYAEAFGLDPLEFLALGIEAETDDV